MGYLPEVEFTGEAIDFAMEVPRRVGDPVKGVDGLDGAVVIGVE
jgi:hypothetical protein